MKKTLFKALLPTMAMILVAVMALTSTTYAWFTTTQTATVGNIDVKVETASSMLVSVVPNGGTATSGWVSSLEYSAISGSEGAKGFTIKDAWKATSSKTGKGGSFYTAEVYTASSGMIYNGAEDTSNYIKFEIYVFNDSDGTRTVTLDGSAVTTDTDVYKATRLSIVDCGTASSACYGGAVAKYSGTEGDATIWETSGSKSSTKALTGSIVGAGIKAQDDSTVTGTQSTEAAASDLSFTVGAHCVKKIAVYFWIEGQDADCINAITNKEMSLSLVFDGEA